MLDSIEQIHSLLEHKSIDDLTTDRVSRAAFERFLEFISEASRRIPATDKARFPDIEWQRLADLGNHLRHAYHRTDREILWNVYEYEPGSLEKALRQHLADKQD